MAAPHSVFGHDLALNIGKVHDLGGQEVGSGHPECRIVLKGSVSIACFAPLTLVDALVAVGVDQNVQL